MQRTVIEVAPGALTEYYDWVKDAAHGDVLVYWQGDLQYDRQVVIPANDVLRGAERMRIATLNVLAARVLEDAKDGLLLLTQKRIGENLFEYRATRRRTEHASGRPKVSNDNLVIA